jgi:hypothetical protein
MADDTDAAAWGMRERVPKRRFDVTAFGVRRLIPGNAEGMWAGVDSSGLVASCNHADRSLCLLVTHSWTCIIHFVAGTESGYLDESDPRNLAGV